MILDERNEFAGGVAIPAAGTNLVGDVIYLGDVHRDIGNGQPIYWYGTVSPDVAGGTSIQLQLITDDNAAMASPTVVATGAVVPLAQLQENPMVVMASLPLEGVAYEEYLGIRAVVVGTFSAGTLTSGLTLDPHGWRAYPEGNN